ARFFYAKLLQIEGSLLALDTTGLAQATWVLLGFKEGDPVEVTHPPALTSLSHIRSRIYGNRFDYNGLSAIIDDVVARRYTDVHLAAFL
ncbi:thymidine phosphorylase, partial [Ochrobactrum sp. SFR4]|nr:thymidine phosphorylase [Ochrobactrum sp. SFR4]